VHQQFKGSGWLERLCDAVEGQRSFARPDDIHGDQQGIFNIALWPIGMPLTAAMHYLDGWILGARRRLTASPMPAETDMEPGSRPRPMARPPYPTHTLRRTPSWLGNCLPIYSSGILESRSSAVRARSFCNGKTLVHKRTIVLKKFSGFLDSYQYDSTLVRPSRCCSIVLGQGRTRLGGPFV
jgi:hypothetical protein